MATKYDIQIISPAGEFASTAVRARKDAAVKFGDALGETYRVVTDSGKVVHEVTIEEPQDAAPAEETVEEDLIGSPADEQPADAEQAEEPAGPTAEEEVAADEDVNARVGSEKFDVAKLKSKIAKMLAKAERTDNEHERETFLAAAERMMLRLGIEKAELEAAGEVKPEEIVEQQHVFTVIDETTLVGFTHRVAQGFGNLTILQSSRGQRRRVVFVIGHKTDVESFMALLASLNLQAVSGLKRFQRDNKDDRAWRSVQEKFVQDRSFLEGFAAEVARRLSALRVETEAEATTGAALVLASKMDRVNAHMEEAYPNLGKARGGNRQYSSVGAAAGRTAGQSANIGGKSVKGGSKGALNG
jgi:hypothetical protein